MTFGFLALPSLEEVAEGAAGGSLELVCFGAGVFDEPAGAGAAGFLDGPALAPFFFGVPRDAEPFEPLPADGLLDLLDAAGARFPAGLFFDGLADFFPEGFGAVRADALCFFVVFFALLLGMTESAYNQCRDPVIAGTPKSARLHRRVSPCRTHGILQRPSRNEESGSLADSRIDVKAGFYIRDTNKYPVFARMYTYSGRVNAEISDKNGRSRGFQERSHPSEAFVAVLWEDRRVV
ncbi:MAG: hypothetical protein AB7G11_05585 [Phycisphaerales bacterium]